MYPNIILSNRLQPSAMVDDATCAACDFNQAKNDCKRRMDWVWRGDYSPATRTEYERTKDQLSREVARDGLTFSQLPEREQGTLVTERLKTYARKAYRKTKITEEQTREDVVCMRANDFYVDTVRQFRDRRYEYKKLNKSWQKRVSTAQDVTTKKQCEDKVLVYDSLQVAHKCILNSFYGYVSHVAAPGISHGSEAFSLTFFWALRLCERVRVGVPWKWRVL
jgi:DNA polymerase epsilon subunit 1